jgi:hypothetical protein
MRSKHICYPISAIAIALLTACGGGGSGGNDPVSLTAIASGEAGSTTTVEPGKPFSFTVTADSPDNKLTALSWSMLASSGAPALTTNNLNCANTDKTDTPGPNGLVSSVWKCTVTGTAPASLGADAIYTFTAAAANTKGSTGTVVATLKVTAPAGDSSLPKVYVTGPSTANSGEEVDLKCEGEGGFVAAGQAYEFKWDGTVGDGQAVQFNPRTSANTKAKMPTVSTKTSVIAKCSVTDSAQKTGVKSHSIEVSPPAVATTITGPNTGPSGTSISLTCAATGGYLGTSGQFTFKWSTVNVGGATLSFDSAERNVVVVSLPTVTKDSAFVATCEATDAGGNKGSASQSINVTAPATP